MALNDALLCTLPPPLPPPQRAAHAAEEAAERGRREGESSRAALTEELTRARESLSAAEARHSALQQMADQHHRNWRSMQDAYNNEVVQHAEHIQKHDAMKRQWEEREARVQEMGEMGGGVGWSSSTLIASQ